MSVLASNVNDAAMECPQIALQVARGHQLKCFSCFNIFYHNIWIFLITNIWIFKICFPCLHKEALTHKIALHEWIICQQPHREEYFHQSMFNVSFHKVKIHRPSNSLFFSRPRTRCTSTVRSGTSYLAQRRTKTQPTSDSTTPRKISWLLREIAFFGSLWRQARICLGSHLMSIITFS